MYYISKTAEIRGNLVVSAEEIGRLRALSSSSFKGGRKEERKEKDEVKNARCVTSSPLSPSLTSSPAARSGEGEKRENTGPPRVGGSSRAYLPGRWHKEAEILSS